MAQRMILDDTYYADQAHNMAPWLIRNGEHRVVGHFSSKEGLSWGDVMTERDKQRIAELVQQKLTTTSA